MMRIKVLEYGFQKTLEEGMEKGREEGMEKGKEKSMEQIKRIKSLYVTDRLSPAEIAGKEQIPGEEVAEILELLGLV